MDDGGWRVGVTGPQARGVEVWGRTWERLGKSLTKPPDCGILTVDKEVAAGLGALQADKGTGSRLRDQGSGAEEELDQGYRGPNPVSGGQK